MKLEAFKVQMYKPILDSGWVDVDDITVVVGKNESGKTALLKALHKFNPFNPEERYALDRDWPRGYRTKRSPDRVVATLRFKFEDAECEKIKNLLGSDLQSMGVEISRTYSGDYQYTLLPDDDVLTAKANERIAILFESLGISNNASDELKEALVRIQTSAAELDAISGCGPLVKISKNIRIGLIVPFRSKMPKTSPMQRK